MARNSWTEQQLQILSREFPGIEQPKALVALLGKTYPAIKTRAKLLGLKRERHAGSVWTPTMVRTLKKLYSKNRNADIAQQLGLSERQVAMKAFQLGLRKTKAFKLKHSKKGRFKKGHKPANKGKKQTEFMTREAIARTKSSRFKKGHLPHNAVGFKDGDISIRFDHKNRGSKAYKYIRIALGKWYPLHQHLWEQQNGKLPKGHCLWFKDGDTMNCELSNLEMITRAENMRRNSCSIRLTDGYVANTLAREKGKVGLFNKKLAKVYRKDKGLIDLKRTQLLLNRAIKSKSDGKK